MGRRVVSGGLGEMNKAEYEEAKLEVRSKEKKIDPPQEVGNFLVFQERGVECGDHQTAEERRRMRRIEEKREVHDDDDDENEEEEEEEEEYDPWEYEAFRHDWSIFSRIYGSFEDTTAIPPMRFTYGPPPPNSITCPMETLQVFSAKPLDVFGFIAIRDWIDHNRNVIFNRARDNCQTLTQEFPIIMFCIEYVAQHYLFCSSSPITYLMVLHACRKQDHNLVLVGPTRAIVCGIQGPATFEVDLKVKGATESQDKCLSFLAAKFLFMDSYKSRLTNISYTSKLSLSTLEFTLGCIVQSVEATIFMRVIRGSWPDDFCFEFAALATDASGKNTACADNAPCIDREKFVLLDSRGQKVPPACDELKVSVKVWKDYNTVMVKEEVFTPLKSGLSYDELDIGFCAVEVNIAWSLIMKQPVPANCRPNVRSGILLSDDSVEADSCHSGSSVEAKRRPRVDAEAERRRSTGDRRSDDVDQLHWWRDFLRMRRNSSSDGGDELQCIALPPESRPLPPQSRSRSARITFAAKESSSMATTNSLVGLVCSSREHQFWIGLLVPLPARYKGINNFGDNFPELVSRSA
ncbi:hypothetical protein U9M48_029902 [Paspalum notatum var. saurae]|uniref:DUF6598 domain-containing protein n=1 Tax=Paspalum notatum var. saurae TaxID=547442 RepID=A0AAQ3X2Q7_PASNO